MEDKLKNLQLTRIDEVKKQKDFEKIEQRLHKKPFYWQVPAVAFSMVLLVLFLVATMPVVDREMNLSSDPYLEEVLFKDGEGDPKSIYYIGVSRTTDEETLENLQASFDTLEPVAAPSNPKSAYNTYRLHYSNGESRVLTEYYEVGLFKDLETGQFYQLADDNYLVYVTKSKSSVWQYVLFGGMFFLLIGLDWYINKNLRVEGDKKRKLPMHSHYTQSIAMVGYLFIVFFMFIGGINGTAMIHISLLYLIGLVFAAISIVIETKHDNNPYRKLKFIQLALVFPTYLFLLIQL